MSQSLIILFFTFSLISAPAFAQTSNEQRLNNRETDSAEKAPSNIKGTAPKPGPYFALAGTLGGTAVSFGGTASVVLRGKIPVSVDLSFGMLKSVSATVSWYSIQGAHSLVLSGGIITLPWESKFKAMPTMGAGYRFWPLKSNFFVKLMVYLIKVDFALEGSDIKYLPWPGLSIGFIW